MKKQHAEQDAANLNAPGSVSREMLTIAIAPGEDKGRGRFADRFSVVVDWERSTWPKSSELAIKRKLVHAIQTTFDTQGFPHQDPVWLVITSKSHEITESLISAVGEVALGQPREVSLADDDIRISLICELKTINDLWVTLKAGPNQQREFEKAINAGKKAPRLTFPESMDQLRELNHSVDRGIDRLIAATALQQVLCSLADCGDAGTLDQKRQIAQQIGKIRKALRASLVFSPKRGDPEAVSLVVAELKEEGQYRARSFRGSKPNLSGTKAFPSLELRLESSVHDTDLGRAAFPSDRAGTLRATQWIRQPLSEEVAQSAADELARQIVALLDSVEASELSGSTKRTLSRIVKRAIRSALQSDRSER